MRARSYSSRDPTLPIFNIGQQTSPMRCPRKASAPGTLQRATPHGQGCGEQACDHLVKMADPVKITLGSRQDATFPARAGPARASVRLRARHAGQTPAPGSRSKPHDFRRNFDRRM